MIPTSSSEARFTAADYSEYLRCPRTAHLRLTGEIPEPDEQFPLPSDRDEVVAHARETLRFPAGADFDRWFPAPPFLGHADVWHPQKPEGCAAVIIREASSLKRSYLVESMFIRFCAEATGELPSRQYVYHLDKNYRNGPDVDPTRLYVASDVTRRASIMLNEHRKRLEVLRYELAADPFLEQHRHRRCSRPQYCPVCSDEIADVPEGHISTLYRGGDLVRQLSDQGYTSIADVPEDLLPHPRQRIQRLALQLGEPVVDRNRLAEFVAGLEYPLHYLDFEAVSSALPRHVGTRPWEHVPYLFSVHTEPAPGSPLSHHAFMMDPARDDRTRMARELSQVLGGTGGVVVYGAPFESGVLFRLGEQFPEFSERMEDIRSRLVDLLLPFKEFVFYDSRQRGKASLKTVLPIFADDIYDGLPIRDGYHANVAYRYLETCGSGCGEAALSPAQIRDALVHYCTMDTLAMVRIVGRLREISADHGRSRSID